MNQNKLTKYFKNSKDDTNKTTTNQTSINVHNVNEKKYGTRERSFQAHWTKDFPWLHYAENAHAVVCFYCHTQEKRGNLKDQTNKDTAFTSKGFSNWKNALDSFRGHQSSSCHKTASSYHLVLPHCADVGELMDNILTDQRQVERKYLLDVIRCLRYLGRQGIALQGDDNNDNFTQLLFLLGSRDSSVMDHINGKIGHKYNHHDVQNELLNLMASQVLRKKLDTVRERRFYSKMADEGTDVSNAEQLSFCVRSANDDLNVNEDFLGFYKVGNTRSATIAKAIKDILLRCSLNLSDCRGQTYDGASNMMGKRSGVSAIIKEEQPKAIATHCQGHSLSLAVKSMTKECQIPRDTMGTAGEICVLVKYSPKRENMLGKLTANVEGTLGTDKHAGKLDKLSTTRWTIRANCFKKIIENYEPLMALWNKSLNEKLDAETKLRINGCKKEMESFSFYFGLNLGRKLYAHTDNLSITLQKEKMSAISGKELAELTNKTMQGMRNERDFDIFYETVTKSASSMDFVSSTTAPRKRKRPKYDILEFVEGNPSSTGEAYYPAHAHYKAIYFEAIDVIVSAIKERFEQPAFKVFTEVEQLLLKSISKTPAEEEMKTVNASFCDDFDDQSLLCELKLLPTIFRESSPVNFSDVVDVVQSLSTEKRKLIKNVVIIIRLVLTMGAISATPER
ncbi:zinc finger MYM-type protein 1-like [Hydractinia symbiolongicarpus]|uniref:zinc finger MYM-type protein 1-like n=1 Tax=Hydractinia symbiolongicarpus TaxID=13093 RepID=UPI002550EA40|nr:zinc finger MYM-type protein 1-like [Hydractinia symbiolongicarpus]